MLHAKPHIETLKQNAPVQPCLSAIATLLHDLQTFCTGLECKDNTGKELPADSPLAARYSLCGLTKLLEEARRRQVDEAIYAAMLARRPQFHAVQHLSVMGEHGDVMDVVVYARDHT